MHIFVGITKKMSFPDSSFYFYGYLCSNRVQMHGSNHTTCTTNKETKGPLSPQVLSLSFLTQNQDISTQQIKLFQSHHQELKNSLKIIIQKSTRCLHTHLCFFMLLLFPFLLKWVIAFTAWNLERFGWFLLPCFLESKLIFHPTSSLTLLVTCLMQPIIPQDDLLVNQQKLMLIAVV